MSREPVHSNPFSHLDPSIWRTTKTAHITLTVIGTLLLLPASGVLIALWEFVGSSFAHADNGTVLALGSALIGTFSGCLAWWALCLLYFKKTDLRWQRIAWSLCAVFGFLTIPCLAGWIIWMLSEKAPAMVILILLAMFAVALACARLGRRYAALAKDRMSQGQAQPLSRSIHAEHSA